MNLYNLLTSALYEGGAASHMKHPYEKFKTPKELLEFFRKFLEGEYKAYEKVDGYNLFVGFDDNGDVVAVRNKNQGPIKNIWEKFDLDHSAYDAFNAGWRAIKSKLSNLSKEDRVKFKLIDDNNKPLNFINLEILFGYIPNLIPYSKTTNYIVFHSLEGSPKTNWVKVGINSKDQEEKLLKSLANKLKDTSVVYSKFDYTLDGDVSKERKQERSYWRFVGPIGFSKEQIRKSVESVVKGWLDLEETKKLIEFSKIKPPKDNVDEYNDKLFKVMKDFTKKIGKEILIGLKSKLSDEIVVGKPGIEGLVIDVDGDLVKITGDFIDYNKPQDLQVVDATKDIREYIQNDILGLNVITFSGVKSKKLKDVLDFILEKRKKKFKYSFDDELYYDHINKIRELIEKAQKDIKNIYEVLYKKGRSYEVKSILSQYFILSKFKDSLKNIKTYYDLIKTYSSVFYRIR